MSMLLKSLVTMFFGVAALLSVGCASGQAHYNVVVSPDGALRSESPPPTIAVDVIALSGEEAANFRSMPMSGYWAPDGQLRKSKLPYIKQFTFGPGSMNAQTLAKDDKIWDAWKGADTLFVLARLASGAGDQVGDLDPRRVIFPLSRDRWDTDTLTVDLFRNRLVRITQPKPEAKK